VLVVIVPENRNIKVTNINSKIIVSRYNEDINFLDKLKNFKIIVYEKNDTTSEYHIIKNKGHEATVYLKYIIDNYDNLDDYTIFLHCHEYSWHQSGSIVDIINNNINKLHGCTNLNNYYLGNMDNLDISKSDLGIFFRKFIKGATGSNLLYPNFTKGTLGCAQFIVHKENILFHSKCFYENIYNWLLETEIDNYWTSRFLEWTWDLFWNKCIRNVPIRKYLNEHITNIELINKERGDIENILNLLDINEYYYVDDNEIIITINNIIKIKCKNQYIYNKFY
jgi:hypothetical protein